MSDILNQIEEQHASLARHNAKQIPAPSKKEVFAVSLIVAPFILIEGMFVPFFGQVVAILAFLTTVYYLRLVGSLQTVLFAVLGATISLSVLMLLPAYTTGSYGALGYFLLGGATFVSIAFIVGIGILIFKRQNSVFLS